MRARSVYTYFQISLVFITFLSLVFISVDGDITALGALKLSNTPVDAGVLKVTSAQTASFSYTIDALSKSKERVKFTPRELPGNVGKNFIHGPLGLFTGSFSSCPGCKFIGGVVQSRAVFIKGEDSTGGDLEDSDSNLIFGELSLVDLTVSNTQPAYKFILSQVGMATPPTISIPPPVLFNPTPSENPGDLFQSRDYIFSINASCVSEGCDSLTYTWRLSRQTLDIETTTDLNSNSGSGSSYTFNAGNLDVDGEHTLSVEVEDNKGGKASQSWNINVLGELGGNLDIELTPDDDPQALGRIVTFEPDWGISGAPAKGLIYVWDFGLRQDPWGEVKFQDSGLMCQSTTEDISCGSGEYYSLGTLAQPFGNPCVCTDSILEDLKSLPLDREQYVYPNSVRKVDSTTSTQFNSYESLSVCKGKKVTGLEGETLYEDAPECSITLLAVDEETGEFKRAESTFSLEQGDNLPPIVHFKANDLEYNKEEDRTLIVAEGTEVTFDAISSVDPDGQNDQLSFLWDFGDGASAVGAQVTHTYVPATEDYPVPYVVSLTVEDVGSAQSSADLDINVTFGKKPTITGDEKIIATQISPAKTREPYDLGSQIELKASAKSTEGNIVKYVWDLGKRDEPWGIVEGGSICSETNGTQRCTSGQFVTIDGTKAVGTPCVCESESQYPYPEQNIYPNSIVAKDVSPPAPIVNGAIVVSYNSFDECGTGGCEVSLMVLDKSGKNSARARLSLTLAGIPGDVVVDGELTSEDAEALYQFLIGEDVEINKDNAECDGSPGITIGDYAQLVDAIDGKAEAKCQEVPESGGSLE